MTQKTVAFTGPEATQQFRLLLSRAFEEDATGGVVGYDWRNGLVVAERIEDINDACLVKGEGDYTYPLVIIDSGNASGDSWKYVYHPLTESGMFCPET